MGMAGSLEEFSEHTSLVYSFSNENGKYTLDAVVVLKSACPILELKYRKFVSPTKRQLRGLGNGGGASTACHSIFISRDKRSIWLDANREIPLSGRNVVMLDDIQNPCADIAIAGMETLPNDFSQEIRIGNATRDAGILEEALSEALKQLPSVKSFCN